MRLMAAARRIAHHDGPYRECDQPAGVALSSFTLASSVYRESGYFYHEPGNVIANQGRCKQLISAIWNDCQSGHATPRAVPLAGPGQTPGLNFPSQDYSRQETDMRSCQLPGPTDNFLGGSFLHW